jgi:hypothetical protein
MDAGLDVALANARDDDAMDPTTDETISPEAMIDSEDDTKLFANSSRYDGSAIAGCAIGPRSFGTA